ncbi:DUF805 domain-containing protein [Pedobacter sp. PWIIR3]
MPVIGNRSTFTLLSLPTATSIILFFLLTIPLFWFIFAQGAKRCHDRGNEGWWQFIPLYGFWMLFADGDIGRNEYEASPKKLPYDNTNYDNSFQSDKQQF